MVPCQRCGGEVVQKPLARLILVGIVMLAGTGLAAFGSLFWFPAIILGLIGLYLILWAAIGRGRWCRGCKRFDGV